MVCMDAWMHAWVHGVEIPLRLGPGRLCDQVPLNLKAGIVIGGKVGHHQG